MAKIAVIGPGAIGLSVGAALMAAGHAVRFCARTRFDTVSLCERGAASQAFPAHVVITPADMGQVDWVVVCVKAHQVAGAADWLGAIGEGANVAVLQNGIEQHETVAPFVPTGTNIVPAIVDLPAARTGVGAVTWHSRANIFVPGGAPGRAFCALFAGSFVTAATDADFLSRGWKKLCVNAPGAILALTGQTMGVFAKPGIPELARAILGECVAVGRAEGADLSADMIETQMMAFLAEAPENGNSIYADRMAGRAMEWNARNGVIVRKGAVHGIPTPYNASVVAILSALDP